MPIHSGVRPGSTASCSSSAFGIKISQATIAKYMLRKRGAPSPTWRSFLRNQAQGIAAIDMFVVASASFRLLYVLPTIAGRLCDSMSPGIPPQPGSRAK